MLLPGDLGEHGEHRAGHAVADDEDVRAATVDDRAPVRAGVLAAPVWPERDAAQIIGHCVANSVVVEHRGGDGGPVRRSGRRHATRMSRRRHDVRHDGQRQDDARGEAGHDDDRVETVGDARDADRLLDERVAQRRERGGEERGDRERRHGRDPVVREQHREHDDRPVPEVGAVGDPPEVDDRVPGQRAHDRSGTGPLHRDDEHDGDHHRRDAAPDRTHVDRGRREDEQRGHRDDGGERVRGAGSRPRRSRPGLRAISAPASSWYARLSVP